MGKIERIEVPAEDRERLERLARDERAHRAALAAALRGRGVHGLLKDATRPPGRMPLTARKIKQVVNLTLNEKPPDATHWRERTMAARAGTAPSSAHKIWGCARRNLSARLRPGTQQLRACPLQVPSTRACCGCPWSASSASNPRFQGTLRAIEDRLPIDGEFVLRHETENTADGLPPGEGAFLACSFWLVDNYIFQGRYAEAATCSTTCSRAATTWACSPKRLIRCIFPRPTGRGACRIVKRDGHEGVERRTAVVET
jgi:hypothetical protein